MIKVYNASRLSLDKILNRESSDFAAAEKVANYIIDKVKTEGDKALYELTERLDGVRLTSLKVSEQEIEEAYASRDGYFLETLRLAAENITAFHKAQLRQGFEIKKVNGAVVGQKLIPLRRAGLYIPGGTAGYPSTVLMNAIPARLAGVEEIIIVTPPAKDGRVNPDVLAAAKTAGVTSIYKIGGAQAVAALAYGTKSVPKVDKIVGPGNVFVAAAKKLVFGDVSIDMIAGPSEILIVSDGSSDPGYLAADMLSQAEHDKNASAILITDDAQLAAKVKSELKRQLALLPREAIARASIDNNGKIIITKSIKEALELANALAPEHLELAVDNPLELLGVVKNAGSVFLGRSTPEAVGDYYAGANHTLPTSGTARFSSPLSCDDFIKKTQYIYYPQEALEADGARIADFANREGLAAHAKSVEIRLKEQQK